MAQDPLSLAKLIASRICHDLISPVGAIANGMELVALTGAGEVNSGFATNVGLHLPNPPVGH